MSCAHAPGTTLFRWYRDISLRRVGCVICYAISDHIFDASSQLILVGLRRGMLFRLDAVLVPSTPIGPRDSVPESFVGDRR